MGVSCLESDKYVWLGCLLIGPLRNGNPLRCKKAPKNVQHLSFFRPLNVPEAFYQARFVDRAELVQYDLA